MHAAMVAGGSGGGVASVHPHIAPGIEAASQLRTSSQARLEGLRQPVAELNLMAFSFGVACGRPECAVLPPLVVSAEFDDLSQAIFITLSSVDSPGSCFGSLMACQLLHVSNFSCAVSDQYLHRLLHCVCGLRREAYTYSWHISHRHWNKLMHALHGNTASNNDMGVDPPPSLLRRGRSAGPLPSSDVRGLAEARRVSRRHASAAPASAAGSSSSHASRGPVHSRRRNHSPSDDGELSAQRQYAQEVAEADMVEAAAARRARDLYEAHATLSAEYERLGLFDVASAADSADPEPGMLDLMVDDVGGDWEIEVEARACWEASAHVEECAICYEPLLVPWDNSALWGSSHDVLHLPCFPSHAYHVGCILSHFRAEASQNHPHRCPECRQLLDVATANALWEASAREDASNAAMAALRDAVDAGDARHQRDLASSADWDRLPRFEQPHLPHANPLPADHVHVAGEWDAIDNLSVLECAISPCSHLTTVPAGLEAAWARAHVDIFEFLGDAVDRGDDLSVERGLKWYLCIHDVLLRSIPRGGRRGSHLLDERFDQWRDGDRAALIRRLQLDRARALRRSLDRQGGPTADRVLHRALKLISEGQLSRGMRVLHASGVLQLTEGVIAQLCRKHPPRRRHIPQVLPGPQQRRVSVTLEESFRRLRRHRAPGVTGRRAEYLIALTHRFSDDRAASVMSHYDDFAASAINAELPSWFYLVWGTGKLIALPKPVPRDPVLAAAAALDPPVRPISIGEVDLGAIMGEVIRQSAPSFQDYLAPQQVAVGVSGGISIVYYGLRLLLCELQPGFVCVRIDLRNA